MIALPNSCPHTTVSHASAGEHGGYKLPSIPADCAKWAENLKGHSRIFNYGRHKEHHCCSRCHRKGPALGCPDWIQPTPSERPCLCWRLVKEKVQNQHTSPQILHRQGIVPKGIGGGVSRGPPGPYVFLQSAQATTQFLHHPKYLFFWGKLRGMLGRFSCFPLFFVCLEGLPLLGSPIHIYTPTKYRIYTYIVINLIFNSFSPSVKCGTE